VKIVDDENENNDLELEIEDRGHLEMREERQGRTRKKPLKRKSVLHKFYPSFL
jgi:hypothetical protein